ncbi:hypothetical protein N8613_01720 [Verrucomicrobia bacterium]|jgi:hypothetical protein|nr:hypothetical protein [Verrucomicrobiota bacterium]
MSDRIQSREFFEQVIVAKIWKDEDFKKEILADPNKTIRALLQERDPEAVDKLPDIDIRVVAETPTQIYVTLPEDVEEPVTAIGDEDKKTMNRKQVENILASRALSDASALAKLKDDTKGALESALQELDPNLTLPDNLKVTLLEESENVVYLVVPPDPTALADSELTEEQLEAVAGGVAAIAVFVVGVVAVAVGGTVTVAVNINAAVNVHTVVNAVKGANESPW